MPCNKFESKIGELFGKDCAFNLGQREEVFLLKWGGLRDDASDPYLRTIAFSCNHRGICGHSSESPGP